MGTILSWPTPVVLLLVLVFVGLCVWAALALIKWGNARLSPANDMPIPAFIGVIATTWALSLGFAASDLWMLGNNADQAVSAERSAVMRLIGSAGPKAFNAPQLREQVLAYAHAVENGDALKRDDPVVENALQDIRITVIQIAGSGLAAPLASRLAADFDELQDARNMRLAVGQSGIDAAKWHLLLALTFLTAMVIALLHIDRPKAGRNAVALYALAALAGLWILVVHVNPLADVRKDFLSHGIAAAT